MSHICDIWPLCSLECVISFAMVDGFSAAHGLNTKYRDDFKGGVSSLMELEGGTAPWVPSKYCEPTYAIWWVAEYFPCWCSTETEEKVSRLADLSQYANVCQWRKVQSFNRAISSQN